MVDVITSARFERWLRALGDRQAKGRILARIETHRTADRRKSR